MKIFHEITFGDSTGVLGVAVERQRSKVARIRRWWVDSPTAASQPGEYWAIIRKVDKHGCLAS